MNKRLDLDACKSRLRKAKSLESQANVSLGASHGHHWQDRSQGANFKLVMIQSSHRFGLAASSPNLSESSLAGWAPVLRLRCAQPRTFRARYASPKSPPAKRQIILLAARPNRWLD